MLNNKGSAAAVAAERQLNQHYAHAVQDRPNSDAGSEIESSSEQSSGYSSRSTRPLQAMPHVPNLPNTARYDSPSQLDNPMSLLASGYPTHNLGLENEYGQGPYQDDQGHHPSRSSAGSETVKAFACATCGKGFARRSDLARHGGLHQVKPLVPQSADGIVQNEYIVVLDLMFATFQVATNNSSSDLHSRFTVASIPGRNRICARDAER